jgi:hypothetical protein
MVEDLQADRVAPGDRESRDVLEATLSERGVRFVSYPEWIKLDALEVERGKSAGRPRVKFARREEILAALGDGRGD